MVISSNVTSGGSITMPQSRTEAKLLLRTRQEGNSACVWELISVCFCFIPQMVAEPV
jgi:hypothetical protein